MSLLTMGDEHRGTIENISTFVCYLSLLVTIYGLLVISLCSLCYTFQISFFLVSIYGLHVVHISLECISSTNCIFVFLLLGSEAV